MKVGFLAKTHCQIRLPLQVLESAAGFYIGTANEEGPVSRESVEYWRKKELAELALREDLWTQRDNP
ncbi:hypothetical protein GCM10011613_25550 [Cellvibrio zantedeschiae]|uniref:DUF2635 domain-containing protein n=1 Tax=Cellvibrio zantedeschiae TaxID=1237077 RepID=A0ABQ3B994_9GAMM|nr:hypothetical protein [Cellvibrio zantedeschiae]GGY79571.1 hypothetical protein GCM10011613_25550 [Cellvibrio zantedeschiae]